jgi:probable F420-dependent oxidoreductase
MRFFLYGTYIPSEQLIEVAKLAETFGFAGITIPDHVVHPLAAESPYPYVSTESGGRAPWDEHCEWPDPFVSASAILASTSSLQVLTGIVVLPMRDPLLVAKGAATLGAMFPGRFILGVGAGWLREEFEILGYDFDTRGPRIEECIAIIRKAFAGGRISHDGRFRSFPGVTMMPVPEPPVSIYIGGGADPAVRRAAQLADGMIPPLNTQPRTAELLERIASLREQSGRQGAFDYVASAVKSRTPADLLELGRLGVRSVHVDPFQLYVRRYGGLTMEERRDALRRYANEVIRPYQQVCAADS